MSKQKDPWSCDRYALEGATSVDERLAKGHIKDHEE